MSSFWRKLASIQQMAAGERGAGTQQPAQRSASSPLHCSSPELHALLATLGLISLWQRADEVMRVCQPAQSCQRAEGKAVQQPCIAARARALPPGLSLPGRTAGVHRSRAPPGSLLHILLRGHLVRRQPVLLLQPIQDVPAGGRAARRSSLAEGRRPGAQACHAPAPVLGFPPPPHPTPNGDLPGPHLRMLRAYSTGSWLTRATRCLSHLRS